MTPTTRPASGYTVHGVCEEKTSKRRSGLAERPVCPQAERVPGGSAIAIMTWWLLRDRIPVIARPPPDGREVASRHRTRRQQTGVAAAVQNAPERSWFGCCG